MNDLRRNFIEATKDREEVAPQVLVVAVESPTGAIETITNHGEHIPGKVAYYMTAYDDDFCLKNMPAIRIRGFMLV